MGELLQFSKASSTATAQPEQAAYMQAVQAVIVTELLQRDRDPSIDDIQAAIDAKTFTLLASQLTGVELFK